MSSTNAMDLLVALRLDSRVGKHVWKLCDLDKYGVACQSLNIA
jgi:hypothetical protein